MDLSQQAMIISTIHDKLAEYVGQRIKVRANMGRSKIIQNEGTLMQVHPQLFIMEVDCKRGRKSRASYQYVDILTGVVEISQDGEPIFDPFVFGESEDEEIEEGEELEGAEESDEEEEPEAEEDA